MAKATMRWALLLLFAVALLVACGDLPVNHDPQGAIPINLPVAQGADGGVFPDQGGSGDP
jgi:hypothetical protein